MWQIGTIWACGVRRERLCGRENVNTTVEAERRKAYRQQCSLTKIKGLQVDTAIKARVKFGGYWRPLELM